MRQRAHQLPRLEKNHSERSSLRIITSSITNQQRIQQKHHNTSSNRTSNTQANSSTTYQKLHQLQQHQHQDEHCQYHSHHQHRCHPITNLPVEGTQEDLDALLKVIEEDPLMLALILIQILTFKARNRYRDGFMYTFRIGMLRLTTTTLKYFLKKKTSS